MNNIFAERLKKAMEQKNMKQIDLVKKAAVFPISCFRTSNPVSRNEPSDMSPALPLVCPPMCLSPPGVLWVVRYLYRLSKRNPACQSSIKYKSCIS